MRIYNLEKIIEDMIENKLSIRQSSEKYKVSKSRLHSQIRKEMEKDNDLKIRLDKVFKNNRKKIK